MGHDLHPDDVDAVVAKNAAAEAQLLICLEHDAEVVSTAAALALARRGSVAAIERLLPLSKGVLGSDLRSAATTAIAAIQSRIDGAVAGQLSLADGGSGGELSLPHDVVGELALAEDT